MTNESPLADFFVKLMGVTVSLLGVFVVWAGWGTGNVLVLLGIGEIVIGLGLFLVPTLLRRRQSR